MRTDGIEKLKSLREKLAVHVRDYLRELDAVHAELRKEALSFLGQNSEISFFPEYSANEPSDRAIKTKTPKGSISPKSHTAIVAEAIDSFQTEFTVNDLIDLIRSNPSLPRISDRAVGRSLSRIAVVEDSPLQLMREGMGSLPNLYRRIRPVVPDLEKIYEWHRQNDLRLRNEAHRNGT